MLPKLRDHNILSFRSYFFSIYYAFAFCLFLLYLQKTTSRQRKTVIIFPSNFENAQIEYSFRSQTPQTFHLHEAIKQFSIAQYYSTFFDNLFSCELDVIAMQSLWNFSSQALNPGRFARSKSWVPKSDEILVDLKHSCIKGSNLVLSFTNKSITQNILGYHLLTEVTTKHDLNLALVVQPPDFRDYNDSEIYCSSTLEKIKDFETLTTFSRKSVYLASEADVPNLINDVISFKLSSANTNSEDALPIDQATRKLNMFHPQLDLEKLTYANTPGIQCVNLFLYFESTTNSKAEELLSGDPSV